MVDVARQNEAVGGSLLTEAGARDYLNGLFQRMGVNPANNIWARNIMQRSQEAAYLMNVMGVQDAQAPQFLQSWLNGRWGQGSSNYGGTDLSRQGISGYVNQAMQNQDPNDWRFKFFNTGDPDADMENLRAAQGLQYGGYARGVQQAQQNVLGDWFQQARTGMQANPNASTNVLDWWYKRQPASGYNLTPPGGGGSGGTGTGGSAYSPTPAVPTPSVPQPSPMPTTPGGGAYNPNPAPGGNVGVFPGEGGGGARPPATPGGGQTFSGWNDLLNKYRDSQQWWGTEGFRPTPDKFTLGGITYDPSQDQVNDWTGMSGSGRTTHRGNFMGQFLYYLQLLQKQRANGGNAALGFGAGATDDQLARIAAERMQKNAVGSTGITFG